MTKRSVESDYVDLVEHVNQEARHCTYTGSERRWGAVNRRRPYPIYVGADDLRSGYLLPCPRPVSNDPLASLLALAYTGLGMALGLVLVLLLGWRPPL